MPLVRDPSAEPPLPRYLLDGCLYQSSLRHRRNSWCRPLHLLCLRLGTLPAALEAPKEVFPAIYRVRGGEKREEFIVFLVFLVFLASLASLAFLVILVILVSLVLLAFLVILVFLVYLVLLVSHNN